MFPRPFPGLGEMRRNPNAMKEWEADARRQAIATALALFLGGVVGLVLAAVIWVMS